MTPPPRVWLRALTPLGWAAALLTACGMLAVIGQGVGLRWDPFDLSGRRLRAVEARAASAEARLELQGRQARGREAQQRRLETHHRTGVSVAAAAARAATLARNSDDASIPLEPDRLARLREHDRQLCDAAPTVCVTAAADPPAGRDDAVSAGPAG